MTILPDVVERLSGRVRPDVWRHLAEARLRGDPTVAVLAALDPVLVPEFAARATGLGADVLDRNDAWGWVLLRVPCDALDELASSEMIDALEIDFVGAPPIVLPAADPATPDEPPDHDPLPLRRPHLATDDLAACELLDRYPTFDGRGVTLAMTDPELPDILAPAFQPARDLHGRPCRKLAAARSTVSSVGWATGRWVDMSRTVTTTGGTFDADGLRWTAPRPGSFRFGVVHPTGGPPAVHPPLVGILWDHTTDEVWVERMASRDFSSVPAMREYHVGGDVGVFGDPQSVGDAGPRRSVGFVVQLDRPRRLLRLVEGTGTHATTILGHAIGAGIAGGRLDGVAPGARLVAIESGVAIHEILRAVVEAVEDPEVDLVVCQPNHKLPPLFGILLDRIAAGADKLVFSGAGNTPKLGAVIDVTTDGSVITVGAYQSHDNYLRTLDADVPADDTVHFASSFGPGANGLLQPDILAPSHLVSSNVGWAPGTRRSGVFALPYGTAIASGTSTAGPIGAAAAALLISAARQTGVDHSPARLRHALLSTARFLEGIAAYQQGRGLLQVEPAWEFLRSLPAGWTPTGIEVACPLDTAEARRTGSVVGPGLFEREGWRPGQTATRTITLTRTSGTPDVLPFALSWLGDTDVFSGPTNVLLPLDEPVEVPVRIALGDRPGVSSAILQVHEPDGLGIARSVACTVVAALGLESAAEAAATWQLRRPSLDALFLDVPSGTTAVRVQVRARQPHSLFGSFVPPTPSIGLAPEATGSALVVTAGESVDRLFPVVEPGVHGLTCQSVGFQFFPSEVDSVPLSATTVDVAVSLAAVRVDPGAVVDDPGRPGVRRVGLDLVNLGSPLVPVVRAGLGRSAIHHVPAGQRHETRVAVEVPEGATTLAAGVAAADVGVSLYLYAPDRHPLEGPAAWGTTGQPALIDRPVAGSWQIVAVARTEHGLGGVGVWHVVTGDEFGTVVLENPMPSSLGRGERWTVEASIHASAVAGESSLAMLVEVLTGAPPATPPASTSRVATATIRVA